MTSVNYKPGGATLKAFMRDGESAEKILAMNEKIDKAHDDKRTARMKAGTKDASHPLIKEANAIITMLKEKRKILWEAHKPIRKEASSLVDLKPLNEAFRKSLNDAVQVKNSGIYSTTANEVKNNFKIARERCFKTRSTLKFHRFDGTGYFAFRFRRDGAKTDGVYFDELFAGNTPNEKRFCFTHRDDTHKKTRIKLKATLAGGTAKSSKIIQNFDMIYHRPIPDGAQIQNGKIMRDRVGDKFSYHLVLTVKLPKPELVTVPKDSAIGIDIGFRQTKDTLQVATIISSDVSVPATDILAPKKLFQGMDHIIELQSILDDSATDLGKLIKPLLKENTLPDKHPKQHLWKSLAAFPNNGTLSFETAYKAGRWLQYEPNYIPEKPAKAILHWWAGYSRRYRELHNLRAKQLLHRKHFYRNIASELIRHKQLIVLEEIDLTKFAKTKDEDNTLNNKARAQRFLCSPSEFRNAITNAADREGVPVISVPAWNTSKKCNSCAKIYKELGAEKIWTCPHCGIEHDRDINAAKNIAALGIKHFAKGKKNKP